jgi:hypothetical protein
MTSPRSLPGEFFVFDPSPVANGTLPEKSPPLKGGGEWETFRERPFRSVLRESLGEFGRVGDFTPQSYNHNGQRWPTAAPSSRPRARDVFQQERNVT